MYKLAEDIEIFGFMGNIGTGKNYIAENIFLPKINKKLNKPTLVMAFADHFKINSIWFSNLEFDKVFIKKDTETRKKLQELGTEMGRNKFGENIWIDIVYNWMKVYSSRGIKRFIITDVRFKNEVKFIKELNGVIIKIDAPDRNLNKLIQESNGDIEILKLLSNHSSETYIKNFTDFDFIINNTIGYDCIIDIDNIIKKIS